MVRKHPLNDFEKNFWIENQTFHDDRNNIVIKLSLPQDIMQAKIKSIFLKTLVFFPNLNYRIKLDNNKPHFELCTSSTPSIIEVKNLAELHKPFDLEHGEVIKYLIVQNHIFISTHHIYFDEQSVDSFIKVFWNLLTGQNYNFSKANLPNINPDLSHTNYWVQKLKTRPKPATFFAPEQSADGLGIIEIPLDNIKPETLREFARHYRISLTAFVVSLTSIVLRKFLLEEQFIIATPVTLRELVDNDLFCGCAINVLPLVISLRKSDKILEILKNTTETLWEALEYRNFSINELLKKLAINRETGLYNILAEFVNQDAQCQPYITLPNQNAKLDFSLSLIQKDQKYRVYIEFDQSKISETYAIHIANAFRELSSQIIKQPDQALTSLHSCDRKTEITIIEQGKGPKRPIDINLVQKILKFSQTNPNKTAIIHNGETTTYRELINLVANIQNLILKQNFSAKPTMKFNPSTKSSTEHNRSTKPTIGICLPRSREYIAAQLALIALDITFVPLDTSLPGRRILEIAKEAELEAIIADIPISSNSTTVNSARDASIDIINLANINHDNSHNLIIAPISIDDIAYIIFTSGSTGKPKGVEITELGFANHQQIMINYFGLNSKSVVAQSAPVSFDISIWQLFCPLIVGGTIDIIDKPILIDPAKMLSKIASDHISVFETVPSLINEYLDYEQNLQRHYFNSAKVITTGESIDMSIAKKWTKRYPDNPLVNAYGPAEASDDTHFFDILPSIISQNDSIPIGHPLDNIYTLVLDPDGQICPPGIIGEICIYGPSLALGYYNDAEKTKRAFYWNDMVKQVVYATGDYGRWLPKGVLGFNGRRDHQVKIRGQRAELNEIEAKIRQILGLEQVAVVLHDFGNNKRLVCFIASPDTLDVNQLKLKLTKTLPDFMVPWKIQCLEHLPFSQNGKLNRIALEKLCDDMGENNKTDLSGSVNRIVRDICRTWGKLLHCAVSPGADFFELGGDSLLCLTVAKLLTEKGYNISPRDILREHTPVNIARIIEDNEVASFDGFVKNTEIPQFSEVQKLYFRFTGKYSNYGEIQAGIYENANLNAEKFNQIAIRLNRTMPFLRLKTINKISIINNKDDLNLEINYQRKLLNPNSCLAIAKLIKQGSQLKILFIIHHLIFDFYSWKILTDNLDRSITNTPLNTNIEDDSKIKIALSQANDISIKIHELTHVKKSETQTFSYEVPHTVTKFSDLKGLLLNSLHNHHIVSNKNITVLDEFSIRNIYTRQLEKSVGWGTYFKPSIYDFASGEFSPIHENCELDINPNQPLIIFNTIADNQLSNKHLQIISTEIYRTVPFIEVDLKVRKQSTVITLQTNLKITEQIFTEIFQNIVSPIQYGFLVDSDFGKNKLYREQIVIEVLDNQTDIIKERIKKIMQVSRSLNTIFRYENDKLIYDDNKKFIPTISDITCLEFNLKEVLTLEREKIPNLLESPPIRFALIDTISHRYLAISYHHVLMDGSGILYLLRLIMGKEKIDQNNSDEVITQNPSEENVTEPNKKKFWQKTVHKFTAKDFHPISSYNDSRFSKNNAILTKEFTKKIYSLAREYHTTPATIIQSTFNCWCLSYFKVDKIGYGLVCNVQKSPISLHNLAPAINTIPFVSQNKDFLQNIVTTNQENLTLFDYKDYPLKDITKLSTANFTPFDILLTITSKNSDFKDFNIYYTHEETGIPLTIDFDFIDEDILITVTSSVNLDTQEIANSLTDFIHKLLKGQKATTINSLTGPNQISPSKVSTIAWNEFIRILATTIGIKKSTINPDKSFVANGGDSILAVRFKNQLNEAGFDTSIGLILSTSSLHTLVENITFKQSTPRSKNNSAIIKKIIKDYQDGYETNYHEQAAFRLLGNYSSVAMEKATQELGRYIPSLTTIYNSDGIAIHTNINRIVYIDLEKSYSNLDSLVKDVSQYDLNQPFDLVQGDLMRIYTAYDSRQKYWYIFLSFSALVSDGWSFSLLLKTLMQLYGREYDKLENLQEKIFTRKKIISGAQNNELTKISINLDAKNINYKSSAQTKSQYYESVIKEVLKRYKFAKLLRYEDKRNQYDNVPGESVGYYVDYTTINLNINSRTNNDSDENSLNTSCTNTKIQNNLNAVYVYENYPKDIENELKSAKIPHFYEFGEWRRPILPPKIDFGIYVEEYENIAKITCYAKPQKWTKKKIKRVLKAIIQQLRDS